MKGLSGEVGGAESSRHFGITCAWIPALSGGSPACLGCMKGMTNICVGSCEGDPWRGLGAHKADGEVCWLSGVGNQTRLGVVLGSIGGDKRVETRLGRCLCRFPGQWASELQRVAKVSGGSLRARAFCARNSVTLVCHCTPVLPVRLLDLSAS